MKRHLIYVYWLLMLVPTLLIGVGAFALVLREQARLAASQKQALQEVARGKAELFAKGILLNLQLVQNELVREVEALPEEQLAEKLDELNEQNPLVRNVFVWSKDRGLILPDPDHPETEERRRFIRRYEALFNGNIDWQTPPEMRAPTNAPAQARRQSKIPAQTNAQPVPQQWFPSSNLRQQEQQLIVAPRTMAHGWLPWYAENQLHVIGWLQPGKSKPIRGVELEMVYFLSRLYQAKAPGSEYRDGSSHCALLNGNGVTMYEEGEVLPDGKNVYKVSIPAGQALPHWRVSCSYLPSTRSNSLGKTLVILVGLLAGIFLLTILLGGSLLLWHARKDARELMQKTSFVSNVSHELKTPLTSIRMYAELLGEKRIVDEEKRKRYLDVIISESQRLSRLVNNVLDFSRLEQGRKKYHPEALDINELIEDVLHNQHLRLLESGMRVEMQLAPELPTVLTDRDAFEQVLINLLDNAFKYASEGGELCIRSWLSGKQLSVSVLDRGPGIRRDQQQKIFDKFHRVDNSLTRRQDGVGLGLSIARRLMLDQGGDLNYELRQGGGADFTIRLPIQGG